VLRSEGHVNSLAYGLDGKTIASVIWKGHPEKGEIESTEVVVWDLQSGNQKVLDIYKVNRFFFRTVAVSANGKSVAASADGPRDNAEDQVKVWDAQAGTLLQTFTYDDSYISCVALSPDGTLVAGGAFDGNVVIWDVKTGKHLKAVDTKGIQLWSIAFSP